MTERTLDYYKFQKAPPFFLEMNERLWQAWAYVQAGEMGRRVQDEGFCVWSEKTPEGAKITLEVYFE